MRRLRGRLVLPVTVWLAAPAGDGSQAPGLTVSSVLVSEGAPAMVAGLVGPLTDLGEHLASVPGARFVVHVLGSGHRRLAEHFAGDVPAPEEMLATATSAFGPLLRAVPDRLFCRTVSTRDFGYSLLVEAEVADADVATSGPGLAWYRGSFWPLGR